MVSHSLNLFWFADVYPTVSHKNCPKKKNKLGTRVLEESQKLLCIYKGEVLFFSNKSLELYKVVSF